MNLTFIRRGRRPRVVKTILENKVELTRPDKTYCKATVIDSVILPKN